MKTVVLFAGLVALALAGTIPHNEVSLKSVSGDYVAHQKLVLSLLRYIGQVNTEAEYYKIGMEYSVESNINSYTNKEAVEEFLAMYKFGFMPKYEVFSIFYERMRDEAIALFNLFYYAKDFDTFYKTACWARLHLNEYQFAYSFYIAVLHRPDTKGFVVPAPYELYPEYFTNSGALFKTYSIKMMDGLDKVKLDIAKNYGIVKEDNHYVFYSNYSNYWSYDNEEYKLSYFTEDVGLNAYYYYFHSYMPFWMKGDFYGILKERRGEFYYYFYQQLMARYYLERLPNGLGEVPEFSWFKPIKSGYVPFMSTLYYPFIQRTDYYSIPTDQYYEELQFLDSYEKTFNQYLQRGHFQAYNQEVDFHNSKSINFVGNFWQGNHDLYEHAGERNFYRSYEITARHLLGAAPEPIDKYTVPPFALNFYQTSLRDPMFYQLYSKILRYFLQYKEHLEPYTQEQLHYVGVKINDVHVEKLVTYFDFYDYDITNAVYRNKEELQSMNPRYIVRQPRLDHKPFSVTIDVKSDVQGEAVFKIFLGPKYDSNGFPISIEDNYMNFYELDWFTHKLQQGQNKIVRNSEDFFFFKDDSVSVPEIFKYLEQGKVPEDMSEDMAAFPNRLMLPKGKYGGYPYQLFVFVYPYQEAKEYEQYQFLVDKKPLGYPFDRPVYDFSHFYQPNMFFEDVLIYFEGDFFPYQMNNPFHVSHGNSVQHH